MSRQETPAPSPGAHRKHRAPAGRARAERESERGHGGRSPDRECGQRPQGTLPMQPPGHYEPYLDGLFTYCLSILCEHDAAAGALGEVLALAERQRMKLRDSGLRLPWLYALARWACLRRLAAGLPGAPRMSAEVAEQRRAQLAALSWPEAAGTTPEQREALELAVRHQLSAQDVAHVLGLDPDTARQRLARAACEVERTRTALAVVDTGRCPEIARLAGETRVLLGPALRAELVRHVDDCGLCRRTAERVVAAGPWPGVSDATAVLALIEAPRSSAYAALLYAMDAGFGRARDTTPRFDRRGFPVDLVERAARRAKLRHRAVTTTVVAAVVAAPVLALWAAYRAGPLGSDGPAPGAGPPAAAPDGIGGVPYEKEGGARPSTSAPARAPGELGTTAPVTAAPAVSVGVSAPSGPPSAHSAAGWLAVTARAGHGRTYVTLTAGGGGPVRWAAVTTAYWLELSARSGVLRPGESITLTVVVDRSLEPVGEWTAEIGFSPGDGEVRLRGASARSVPTPPPSPTSAPSTSPPPPTTTPPPTSAPPTDPPTDSPSPTTT